MTTSILLFGNFIIFMGIIYSSLVKENIYFLKFQIFVYICFISLFISMRDFSGLDTLTYMEYFSNYDSFSSIYNSYFSWKGDYFFFFLGWLIKRFFTQDAKLYIIFIDFFSILLMFFGYYRIFKLSKMGNIYFFSILILFIFSTSSYIFLFGNVIRQGMAFSLIILSVSYFIENKNKRGIFLYILAIFTHKSSIIFFPAIILAISKNINWKYIYSLFFMSFVFYKLDIISKVADMNILFVSEKILAYKDAIQSNLQLKLLILIIDFIYFSLYINKNYIYDVLFKIWTILLSISLISAEIPKLTSRLILYNSIITPFLFFMTLFLIKRKYFNIIFIAYLIFTFLYSTYIYSHNSILNTLHYSNTIV